MRHVRLLDAAAIEAIEAAAWYEHEQPGLGARFEEAIEAALDLLQEDIVPLTPMPGEAGKHGVKRLVLRQFPYDVVIYELPRELIVIAIAHQSRRPGYWQGRLRT